MIHHKSEGIVNCSLNYINGSAQIGAHEGDTAVIKLIPLVIFMGKLPVNANKIKNHDAF